MKYLTLILFSLFVSCNRGETISEAQREEFVIMAQNYQSAYMDGSENCEEILTAIDENIQMWENGKVWTYSELKEFCPHLPEKNVVATYNDQKLLNPELGYDYVSQLFVVQSGDTMRETSSRLWEKKDEAWKIVKMNNLIMMK